MDLDIIFKELKEINNNPISISTSEYWDGIIAYN